MCLWVLCGVCGVTGFTLRASAEEQAAATVPDRASAPATVTLNGTWWAIELEPLYAAAASPEPLKDTLAFTNGKVASALLAGEAFPSAPFTTTLQDGVPVWEATQSSQRSGIVFWKGRLLGKDRMEGSFSRHPLNGESEFCSFTGHQVTETESAQTPPAPASTSAAPTPSVEGTSVASVVSPPAQP